MTSPASLILGPEGLFHYCHDPAAEPLPAFGYARDTEGGGLRLHYRVVVIGCEGCGAPLKRVQIEGGDRVWRCGTPSCNRTWHLQIVREPGGPELLALVLKHL
jgi:hypothetical protein